MLSRPVASFEKVFFQTNEVVQYAVELTPPHEVDRMVDYLQQSVPACHLRTDGVTLFYDDRPLPITKIPPSVKSARDAAIWAGSENLPNFKERLATIATSGNLAVLAATHSIVDGVSILHLTDRFLKGTIERPATFPTPVEHFFASDLSAIADTSEYSVDNSHLSVVPWSNFVAPNQREDALCEYQFVELPPSAFQCFDARRGRLVGFTDALWQSAVLACAATGSSNLFGCSTCVNLRPFGDLPIVGNLFAPLLVIGRNISEDMTVADLSKGLRSDFTEKMKRKGYLTSLKATLNGYQMLEGRTSFVDVSNVGNFEIRAPILDLWVQQTMKSRFAEGILALLSFSVTGARGVKVIVRWQSSPTVINRADSARAFKAVLHSLQSIRPSAKVGDAIREIRQVINS
jgi:hypothetical protein